MKRIFVLCLFIGIAIGVSPPAQANGLHQLVDENGNIVLWQGGCFASVWIEPAVDQQYGAEIRQSLGMLAKVTGIQFAEVATSEAASLRYKLTVFEGVEESRFGEFEIHANTIHMRNDAPVLRTTARKSHNLKLNLALHETMHWLGLGHDVEMGEFNEIMDTIILDTPVRGFGEGDLAGLAYVSRMNGCKFSMPAKIAGPRGLIRI